MIMTFEDLAGWLPPVPSRGVMVQVLTSCTSIKGKGRKPAEELYEGQQHRRLMRGVRALRASGRCRWVRVDIVSAGYGIIDGEKEIEPYDASFSGFGRGAIHRRAKALGIPGRAGYWMANTLPDIKLVLLGNEYLEAVAFDFKCELFSPTVVLCSGSFARSLPDVRNLAVVKLDVPEASQYGCGLVSLKGELAARLLETLAHDVRCGSGGHHGQPPEQAVLRSEGLGRTAL